MIIKFDLLNNSIDYLENSLLAYIQANENGEYGVYADKKNKSKFKVSFVLLCQAMELLLKYRLVIEKIFGNNIFFEIQNIYRERY